jgi:hypothetical protein
LIAVLLVPVLLMGGGALIVGALIADVHTAYVGAIVETGKEPAFLLTLAFLCTFGLVRLITYSIHSTGQVDDGQEARGQDQGFSQENLDLAVQHVAATPGRLRIHRKGAPASVSA